MSSRRISIIVPCLNEGAAITSLLGSLQALRKLGHQLIVVDGGSDDDTTDRAAPLVDQLIRTSAGRAHQMNAGSAVAEGDILWFLHADSILPDNIALELSALNGKACCWGRFDIRLSGRDMMLRVVERMMNLRSRLSGIATGDQGIFVEQALFDQVGGYPDIPLMEDIALSKKLRKASKPLCLKAKLITSSRRWERDGVFRTIWLMWRLRLAYALGADPHNLAVSYRQCSTPTQSS